MHWFALVTIVHATVWSSQCPNSLAQQHFRWSNENSGWAPNCVFYKSSVRETIADSPENCGPKCEDRKSFCTHFNYRKSPGSTEGICEFMAGRVRKHDAVLSPNKEDVCGVSVGYNIIWNTQNWASDCEFDGADMLPQLQLPSDDCRVRCDLEPECTHFSWSKSGSEGEGTCRLMKGLITKWEAYATKDKGAVCGVKVDPRSIPVEWQEGGDWGNKCNFTRPANSAISNVPSASADDCRQKCTANQRCTHYTWAQSDRLCHLMKGRSVSKADAVTIVADGTAVCGIVKCSNASAALKYGNIVYIYAVIICSVFMF